MLKKVVIVGGGFAGVRAALDLANDPRFHTTLISNRSSFEYHAALYRSVTGRSVLEVTLPLSKIFQNDPRIELVEDTVATIDNANKMAIGADGSRYSYDILVMAIGNVTAYYDINGLAEHSYGVKSVDEALRLKRHLHEQLNNPNNLDTHYVVVGAGPSGIELAAELQGYIKRLYRNHQVKTRSYSIDLVEAADSVLPNVPQLSAVAGERLRELGINVFADTSVMGETLDTLKLPHGDIKTHTVIWTAGVTGHPLFAAHPEIFTLGKGGRVEVNSKLQAAPHVYVIGDSALTPYSGMAQTALYDGRFVAKAIKGRKVRYNPPKPISAIPIGHKWCAVAIGPWRLYGKAGWFIRRYMDLWLYLSLLPLGAAVRAWLSGTRQLETCPVCVKR